MKNSNSNWSYHGLSRRWKAKKLAVSRSWCLSHIIKPSPTSAAVKTSPSCALAILGSNPALAPKIPCTAIKKKTRVNHLQSIDLRVFFPQTSPPSAHHQPTISPQQLLHRASGVSVPLALLSAVPVAGQAPRRPWSRCLVGSTHFEAGRHSIHSSPPTRGNHPEIWN